jgi:hypothetical protein
MNFIFAIFPILFLLVFLTILGVIISGIVTSARRNAYNNRQPILTVSSRVLTRRTSMSQHHHANHNGTGHHGHVTTTYFATFEVESGNRMEFEVPDSAYGLLLEGDYGKLTFQGTRFLNFVRDLQPMGGWQSNPTTAQQGQSLTQP